MPILRVTDAVRNVLAEHGKKMLSDAERDIPGDWLRLLDRLDDGPPPPRTVAPGAGKPSCG